MDADSAIRANPGRAATPSPTLVRPLWGPTLQRHCGIASGKLYGSSGVPGSWCWVVRRKLLFSNDLWRKAGHSVYRTQVTEIKRLTMNLREQPPGTPEEPWEMPPRRKRWQEPKNDFLASMHPTLAADALFAASRRHDGQTYRRRSRLSSSQRKLWVALNAGEIRRELDAARKPVPRSSFAKRLQQTGRDRR